MEKIMFVFNLELRIYQTHITRKHASSDKRFKDEVEMMKGDDVVACLKLGFAEPLMSAR